MMRVKTLTQIKIQINKKNSDCDDFSQSQSASHYFSKPNIKDEEKNENKNKSKRNEYIEHLMPLSPAKRPIDIQRSRYFLLLILL